jgi:hypothetical protein
MAASIAASLPFAVEVGDAVAEVDAGTAVVAA